MTITTQTYYTATSLADIGGVLTRPAFITVTGGAVANDLVSATYKWFPGDVTAPNGTTVIQPASGAAGRYKSLAYVLETDRTQLYRGVDNGLVYSDSAGLIQSIAKGATGELLIGTTGSPPSWASGQAVATASNLGYVVPTLAALKALTARPTVFADGNEWGWFPGDTTPENCNVSTGAFGTVVAPTSGTAGRYKRIYSGEIFAEWFGATTSTSVSSLTAINAALTAAGTTPVRLPATSAIDGTINIPSGATLVSSPTSITCLSGNYGNVSLNGDDASIVGQGLTFLNSAKSGGYDIVLACGSATINRLTVTNVLSYDSYGLATDTGIGSGKHIYTIFNNVVGKRQRGPGINFRRAFAYIYPTKVVVDYINSANANYMGFSIDGATVGGGGAVLTECNVSGTSDGTAAVSSQDGFSITNWSDVTMDNCLADACGGKGYIFGSITKLELSSTKASLCNNTQMEFTGCAGVIGTVSVYGRKGLTAASSIDGIKFVSGNYNVLLNAVARDNTGNGVNKAAAQGGSVEVILTAANNTGYGASLSGNSGCVISGQFAGNTAGDYNIVDNPSVNVIIGSQINSGAVVLSSTGATINGQITGPTFAPGNNTPSTFYTGNLANSSWPYSMQGIYDGFAVDMYLLFGGALGSTATRAAPTITSGFDSVGIRRDYSGRQTLFLAAAAGTNATPTYPFGFTDAGVANVLSSYKVAGTQVVAARNTGWTAMTGSSDKATSYDTSTVTTAQLAGRVMAIQAAITTHGLLGA